MRIRACALLLALAAGSSGCRRPPRARGLSPRADAAVQAAPTGPATALPPARAFPIETPGDLLAGPLAAGRVGDVRLDNGVAAFVVQAIRRPFGFAASGGNVVDAAALPGGRDEIAQVFLYLAETFPRQAVYGELACGETGSHGGAAVAVAKGVDSADPRIAIETTYVLEPGARALRIETTIVNGGNAPVRSFDVGDAILWGAAEPAGDGSTGPARGSATADILAAVGPAASYAYLPAVPRPFRAVAGEGWTDVVLATADLPAAGTGAAPLRVVRYLAVGDRADTAGATASAREARGDATARIVGRAVGPGGEAVPGALLRLSNGLPGGTETVLADDGGRFDARVPAGGWTAAASAPGRSEGGMVRIAAPTGAPFEAPLSAVGRLDVDVLTGGFPGGPGRAPVRVVVRGAAGTPDPEFGTSFEAGGSRNSFALADGRASRPLAPGAYDVIATRGPEFDVIRERVEVAEGGAGVVHGTLERRVETPGYVAADLHVHTAASADSGVAPRDRALACAAEGLDAVVVTDHDVATDLADGIEALDLEPWLAAVSGTEVTTDLWPAPVGHLGVFPLAAGASAGAAGASRWLGPAFPDLLAAVRGVPGAIAVVHHPRSRSNGTFALLGLETPTWTARGPFSPSIDALEVANGLFFETSVAAVADWAALVSCGYRVVPTGGSDSHRVSGGTCGFPRTWVFAGADEARGVSPASLAAAVRSGRVVVSTGPFLLLSVDGRSPGETLATVARGVLVGVRVEAAPWVDVRRVRVFVNGGERLSFAPTARPPEPVRLDVQVPLALAGDSAIWADASGDEPLATLEPGSPIRPWAVTGAVWVDSDGDGVVRPGGVDGRCP